MGKISDALQKAKKERIAGRPEEKVVSRKRHPQNEPKTLQSAKVHRSSIEPEEKIASKTLHSPLNPKKSVAAKENVSQGLTDHQTPNNTYPLPAHDKNRQDTEPHQISANIKNNKKNFEESFIDKNKIAEKLVMLRRENSKHSFKKAKVKKQFFKKKRKENLFTVFNPTSIISEYFKFMRTQILNMAKEKNIRTILVTSALPEEGKSFVSSNLAASIATGLDQHVLLVDADLKKPTLDELLKIKSKLGLSDFLVNEKHQLSDLIQKTKVPKLSFLPSGTLYERSSELLASEVMKMFVMDVKYRYDDRYIIFDSPPAQISETLGLADKVDGIILVVKAGKTNKKLVSKTAKILSMKKNMGIVLNYCSFKSTPYYKYYKYF